MKKYARFVFSCILCVLIFSFVVSCGKKKEQTPSLSSQPLLVSAEKNSFNEVTKNLNSGGDFYLYLGTEKWLEGLSTAISGWRQTISSIPDIKESDQANVNIAFDLAFRLIKNSGVEEISGVGMSSIAREKGLYHMKAMLHHYKNKNLGYLWSFFGKKSHPLDSLDFLPSTTAFAGFSDLDIPLLWSKVREELSKSQIPAVNEWLESFPVMFSQLSGITWEEFLASLSDQIGLVVTLDETKKIRIPMQDGKAQEIPEPALMFIVKVKNDAIFNCLDRFLVINPQVSKVDQNGVKMRIMPLPIPLPIQVRPTIARSGDYLFLASTDTLIQEALNVKEGKKKGLKSSEEFKKLSQGIPQEGNHFSFISQKFGLVVNEFQKGAIQMSSKNQSAQTLWMQQLASLNQTPYFYGVYGNTEEGWLMAANGNVDMSKALLAQTTIMPIALVASIATPSFMRARDRAKATTILNEARQIDAAKDQYALENNKTGNIIPTWNDLTPYLQMGSKFATSNGNDSLGNPFIIGEISTPLKVNPATKKELEKSTGGDAFWGPYS